MSFIRNFFSQRDREDPPGDGKEISVTFDLLRVSPHVTKEKNVRNDRLTDLIIVLFVFAIAVWFRFHFRLVYLDVYSRYVFDLQIAESDPLGFGQFLGLEPKEIVNSEGYGDFYAYYYHYVQEFANGWNPYLGSDDPDSQINGYVYGPFYMYSIAIGKTLFDLGTFDSIVYSNIIIDSLTYVMVYILGKRVTGNITAMVVTLVTSFSPISLFYIAYRGLNAPIMNLVFLVFLYFYLEKRDTLSMFFLALAILTKQFPMFMLMPLGFWFVRRNGFLKGIGLYLQGAIFLLVLSIPYILVTPVPYVIRLFLAGGGKSVIACPVTGEATNLVHAMIPPEACAQNGTAIVNPGLLPHYIETIHLLVNSHLLFVFSLVILGWLAFTAYDYFEEQPRLYFIFTAGYYMIAHATIARGIFKYYLTFIVPLFVLAFMRGNLAKSLHLRLGAGLKHGWNTWLEPKYRLKKPNIFYWIYFLILITATLGIFWIIGWAISIFDGFLGTHLFWMMIFFPLALYFIIKPSPTEVKFETFEISSGGKTYLHAAVFIILASIGYRFLRILGDLYFSGDQALMLRYSIIAIIFATCFLLLPFFETKTRDNNKNLQFYMGDPKQLFIDTAWFVFAFFVLVNFHRHVFLVHRHYTSLIMLIYSFIPLAMLGGQVWTSVYRVPIRVYGQVSRIFSYV